MGGDISLGYSIVASVLVKMAMVGNLWEKISQIALKMRYWQ